MDTYTFILEYNGGTYVSQISADSAMSAAKIWIDNPNIEMLFSVGFFDKRDIWILNIGLGICYDDEWLTPIDTIKSVWFFSFLQNNIGGYVHVVKTKI